MGMFQRAAASFLGSAACTVVNHLYGARFFAWVDPMIPHWVIVGISLSDFTSVALAYGPPAVLAFLGLYFAFEGRKVKKPIPSARSSLRITCGETGPFFKTGGNESITRRTFNLKVENIGSASLTNCRVWISSIKPPQGHGYEAPWVVQSSFAINSGDFEFIAFATYGESRYSDSRISGDTFFLFHVEGHSPLPSRECAPIVTVRATATETTPAEFRCKLWVDETGGFRIQEV
jgi:hypothetical protein